mmetsp:Transcript_43486/g.93673  ORF Transcript_43486/g.93673 Transcript_43486/m.93673 type:complete len:381 (-) Transcript_43486:92-1234(-)
MAIRSHWVVPMLCVVLPGSTAEEVSCSGNLESEGSSCSSSQPSPIDFIAMADDLDALNRSTGNKLYEIQRFPCSGDWHLTEVPIILEGCCWASGSAFQKGKAVVEDCSNEEDFLPLDHFNVSLDFLLEHCGAEEIQRPSDSYAYEGYVKHLLDQPMEVHQDIDEKLLKIFNLTLQELDTLVRKTTFTIADYGAQMRNFQVRHRPEHVLGFFNPLSHSQLRTIITCPAVKQQLREAGFPMPSFFRPLPRSLGNQRERMREWGRVAGIIAPAYSSTFPAHLHREDGKARALALMEGKKHWQLIPVGTEAFSDLHPVEGYTRSAFAFHKSPIDVADEHPVYVGVQSKGDVLISPRNFAHYVYNIEDSVAILFVPSSEDFTSSQ